jgi:hypothetical protein
MQVTLTWSKLSPSACRHLTSISAWCHSWTDAKVSVVSGGGLMCTICHYSCAMYMLKSKESSQHQSVCVFNIRVSVWCVNRYFKEVGVLKVTFHHNLLEQFCNLFDIWLDL